MEIRSSPKVALAIHCRRTAPGRQTNVIFISIFNSLLVFGNAVTNGQSCLIYNAQATIIPDSDIFQGGAVFKLLV